MLTKFAVIHFDKNISEKDLKHIKAVANTLLINRALLLNTQIKGAILVLFILHVLMCVICFIFVHQIQQKCGEVLIPYKPNTYIQEILLQQECF